MADSSGTQVTPDKAAAKAAQVTALIDGLRLGLAPNSITPLHAFRLMLNFLGPALL